MARKSEANAKIGLVNLGCEIDFQIVDNENIIKVFTTRPDTIFGASFIALSVDHHLSKIFLNNIDFNSFKNECDKTGTTEEALANADKIGFNTNLFAQHPLLKIKKSLFTCEFRFNGLRNWCYFWLPCS